MDEKAIERYGSDNILIFDQDQLAPERFSEVVSHHIESSEVTVLQEKARLDEVLDGKDFDIVVLNADLSDLGGEMLLRKLQLRDHTPSVLLVSSCTSSKEVASLYAQGCERFIPKDPGWLKELGLAIAATSRRRRDAASTGHTLAQLSEVNRMLKEKNRRLDEFGMSVAHDVRGPLGAISMNVEFVLDTYGEQIPDRAKDLLSRALNSSERLMNIIQAMYSYAKMGAKAAKMAEVDLHKLVQEVASDLRFSDSLDIELGIAELPTVWGSDELLRVMFQNLITNAVKYNDKQSIRINIGCRGTIDRPLGASAEIFVSDNGPGIPQADQKNIFQIFSRSASNSAGKEGLGLGLALVQRIVELHYGSVSVDSEPGEGTTFTLALPLQRSELVE